MTLKLAELSTMPEPARNRALDDLVRSAKAPPNGQLCRLDDEISKYEQRYEMTSDEMRAAFKAGEVRDTADISRWLILLQARGRVVG